MLALAVSALLVGFYAYYSAQRSTFQSRATVAAAREECAAAVEAMQANLERMAVNLRPAPVVVAEPIPGTPKSSMNLSKRSQALRMRRQGDSAQRISELLEMPLQEVELLLKVHEIVLTNMPAA
jgi:hypothetical protein